jgi:hypothetical protein
MQGLHNMAVIKTLHIPIHILQIERCNPTDVTTIMRSPIPQY